VFIAEQSERPPEWHPVLRVADVDAFNPRPAPPVVQEFIPQLWGVVEAIVRDPDGRLVSLQAPPPRAG
jgi:hypothetical protein